MAPRRKRRRMIAVKKTEIECSGLELRGGLSGVDSKTRKLQKKQIILPEQIDETLELIGLQDSDHSKDAQIRGILNYLKDTKIGTYVRCCVCNTWFFLSDIKDVQEIPGKNSFPLIIFK